MKVLANDGISASAKATLESKGFTVETTTVAQDQLITVINQEQYEVILVRSATKIRKDIIDACSSIKMIGRGGVGMDNIDVAYGREKGINVFNTPASSSLAVAELVIALMFDLARQVYDASRQMPVNGAEKFNDLKKKYGKGAELRGKTIGIIGFGRIGQYVAKYALGCGMNVIASDPFVSEAIIPVEVADQVLHISISTQSFESVIQQADYISLHIPMPADKKAVIGAAEFAQMKKGVRIINAARGGVIDEDALLEALNNGTVAAAGLDVFVNEPTPREDLLKHPLILATPHIGAATNEAQDRIGDELAAIIIEHYKGI
jgi:D-3-phosphoglycerate dehydrogenase / 2-oxoglutarate reductase